MNVKVGGALFIAGWFYLENLESAEEESIAEAWVSERIDLQKVKKNINKSVVLISTDDPYGALEKNAKVFREELGSKVIIQKNAGHFDAPIEPHTSIVMKEFLKIAK